MIWWQHYDNTDIMVLHVNMFYVMSKIAFGFKVLFTFTLTWLFLSLHAQDTPVCSYAFKLIYFYGVL